MQITDNTVVELNYKLTIDGELIDESEAGHPLAYIHGNGNLIPGMENALSGKSTGDKFGLTLEPKDAYGKYDDALSTKVDRSELSGTDNLEVGLQLEAQFPEGTKVATVKAIDGDEVTIDGNHPLAGERLNFEIEVVGVRAGTEEELAHGHPHGPGGAH